ncbi:MAG: prepilin-type N-terminal cleavage/methylation domain-containing protein [Nitrospirae bacterium]|nr:prepilin-type N-terminal cleavage/methylation domain-containing protein [Nitrospirota bacterium]
MEVGNRNGFTLIEILVALALAAVVIGSAYTLLFTVKKGTAGVYEKMREKEQAFNLLSMIRKEVESIYYVRNTDYTGIKIEEKDFYGKPASRLTFTCFFRDGIKVISYAVAEDREGRLNLIKTIADVIKGGQPITITVLKDVEGFSAQVLDEGYDKVYDSTKLKKVPKDVKITLILKGVKGGEAFSQICSLMLNDAL